MNSTRSWSDGYGTTMNTLWRISYMQYSRFAELYIEFCTLSGSDVTYLIIGKSFHTATLVMTSHVDVKQDSRLNDITSTNYVT